MRDRTPVQTFATIVGAAFLLIGIAGFLPGITADYGDMAFAGPDSEAELLGLFQVSVLHNLVHVLFGIAGLALARSSEGARTYLVGGGVVYLVLAVYGVLVAREGAANFVPMNAADDWLHFALGLGMIAGGILLTRGGRAGSPA